MARMKSAQTVYYGPAYSGYRRWAAFRQMNPSIFFGRRELGAISGILYLVQQIKNADMCLRQL